MRRQFRLPSEDEAHLESTGLPWEVVTDGGTQWVLMHDRPVPTGYNLASALTAVAVAPGYPDSPLDMVYFFPALARADGRPINALTTQAIDGKQFQRWSRHRTGTHPWRPGLDDLAGHLALVDYWLSREFTLR